MQRIAVCGFWNSIGIVTTRALMFGTTILLARLLSKNEFGDYGYLWGLLMSVMMFVDGPWSSAVTKYVAEYRESNRKKAGQVIAFYSLFVIPIAFLVILVSLCSANIATRLQHAYLSQEIVWILLSLIPLATLSIMKGTINGLEEFKINSILFPALGLSDVVFKIAGALIAGFQGLIIAIFLSCCLQLFIAVPFFLYSLKKHSIKLVYKNCQKVRFRVISFTLPNLLYIILTMCGNIFVTSMFMAMADGSITLSYYNVISQLQMFMALIPLILLNTFLAIFSNAFKNNPTDAWRMAWKMFFLILGICLFFGVGIAIFAGPLLSLYGSQFVNEKSALIMFIPAMMLHIVCPFLNTIFSALAKIWQMFFIRIAWLVVLVGMTFYARHNGITGMVISILIADIVWFGCAFYFFIRCSNVHASAFKRPGRQNMMG